MAKANARDASLWRTVETPHALPHTHTHKGRYLISGVSGSLDISPNSTAFNCPQTSASSKQQEDIKVICHPASLARGGGGEAEGDSQTTLPTQQVSNPLNLALSSLL